MAKKSKVVSKVRATKRATKQSATQPAETKPTPPAGHSAQELKRRQIHQQDKLFPVTKTAFKTSRLIVYSYKLRMSNKDIPRTVFLGFEKDCEFPRLIVSATVWVESPFDGNYLEWLEVVLSQSRRGYATEFRVGLKKHLGGELSSDPTTEEGEAFVASLRKRNKA